MRKTYICNNWPFLTVGGIQFRDGRYSTDNENVQRMIESRGYYGIHVRLLEEMPEEIPEPEIAAAERPIQEEIDEMPTEPPRRRGRPPVGARQGSTGTSNLR